MAGTARRGEACYVEVGYGRPGEDCQGSSRYVMEDYEIKLKKGGDLMVYQWKIPLYKVDAQAAGEELERISKSRQALTPEAVVDESRPEDAILHGCFEWNDKTAAERYRESQAQHLIQNIVTVIVEGEDSPQPVRAFVNIQNDYKPMDVVIKSKDYSDEMLNKALCELKSFQNKYNGLQQLSNVFKAISSVLEEAS